MKSVKITANLLFYLTRLGSMIFLATAIYVATVIILSYAGVSGLPIKIEDGVFVIHYPFTESPFVLGDYYRPYLVIIITVIFLYALFLWLLSSVFNAFRQEKWFTQKGVARLKRFSTTNLTIPFIFLLLLVVFKQDVRDVVIIGFLHLMIGVFAFFMSAIFRQGLVLQEEHDLTL